MRRFIFYRLLLIIVTCILSASQSHAYSVLTHEAIIDATWDKSIQPLLLERYPGATKEQVEEARAYAYGGSVAPDMGYYPFGAKQFTELAHYVRTGDLVNNMLAEAQNLDEYAFALGFLCHYNADKYGHSIGVNRSVPLLYDKDKQYGAVVTYEQDPVSHIRTEFGFDVLQTARGNYASEKYHGFIGFKVSKPLLERAFLKTYGLDINDMFPDFPLAVETFRWIVKSFFPEITRAAWAARKKEIREANPNIDRRKFEYRIHTAQYYREFGKKHHRPGVGASVLALVVRVAPKVGPLKDLKIKIPNAQAEKLFVQSFDTVSVHYTACLDKLHHTKTASLQFADIDFDTGHNTYPGEYGLADKNYILLLLKLKQNNFKNVDADLRQNIIQYYSQCNERLAAMAGTDQWNNVNKALEQLIDLKVGYSSKQ
jgi:hypothetical protein